MKAAVIKQWGDIPTFQDVDAPPPPSEDQVQIAIIAVGLHRLVRMRASGKHYSVTKLPHTPGSDGVGRTISDGKLVYFTVFWEQGSYAEVVNVTKSAVTPVPEGSDPVQIAGLVNPALSSWMAFSIRLQNLPPKFSVLILGGTTISGKVALRIARTVGAGKVIGAARSVDALKSLGYDDTIALEDDPTKTDFSKVEEVDAILDYIYGPATVQLLKALKPMTPVQYLQIGTLSNPTMELPGDILRSKDITIRGCAPGSYSMQSLAEEMPKMLAALKDFPKQEFKTERLKDIEKAWPNEKTRQVFVVSDQV